MTRLQQLAFRAALAALRALQSVRNEVAWSIGLDPAAEVRVHSGPWCIMRRDGQRPEVFAAFDYGTVKFDIAKEWHMDGIVVVDVCLPELVLVMRRDEQVTGITAERMVQRAEEDRRDG